MTLTRATSTLIAGRARAQALVWTVASNPAGAGWRMSAAMLVYFGYFFWALWTWE